MDRVPPKIPPRTHPIHVENLRRLKKHNKPEDTLTVPDVQIPDDDHVACPSRRASSVGFVDVNELMKFQEDDKIRSESTSARLYSSIRHIFSSSSTHSSTSNSTNLRPSTSQITESHINPMFGQVRKASITSISRSLTHLPYPPKKRKSHLRRVFSCFSIFRHA